MAEDILLFERRGPVGLVTLNRPESMNSLNHAMFRDLLAFLARCEDDYETRVLVLTGAGRMFCAGADLKTGPETWHPGVGSVANGLATVGAYGDVVRRLRRIPQPIIAAVNGAAAGGGFSIALGCDMRFGSPAARFACSYVQVGLGGGEMGSSFFLPRLLGSARAADLMYTGRVVEAEEALQMGIISRIVPAETLVDEAVATAQTMAEKVAPFALRVTKEVLTESLNGLSLDAALKMEGRNQILASHTDDAKEARSAFLEKRPAGWRDY